MYFVSKKLKKKYNITDERAALYEAAETWVDALSGREFLGMHLSLHHMTHILYVIYMIVLTVIYSINKCGMPSLYDPCRNRFLA